MSSGDTLNSKFQELYQLLELEVTANTWSKSSSQSDCWTNNCALLLQRKYQICKLKPDISNASNQNKPSSVKESCHIFTLKTLSYSASWTGATSSTPQSNEMKRNGMTNAVTTQKFYLHTHLLIYTLTYSSQFIEFKRKNVFAFHFYLHILISNCLFIYVLFSFCFKMKISFFFLLLLALNIKIRYVFMPYFSISFQRKCLKRSLNARIHKI